jgi:hypothetical protein
MLDLLMLKRYIFKIYLSTFAHESNLSCFVCAFWIAKEHQRRHTLDSAQAPARHLLELHRTPDQIISPDESTGLEVLGVPENDT